MRDAVQTHANFGAVACKIYKPPFVRGERRQCPDTVTSNTGIPIVDPESIHVCMMHVDWRLLLLFFAIVRMHLLECLMKATVFIFFYLPCPGTNFKLLTNDMTQHQAERRYSCIFEDPISETFCICRWVLDVPTGSCMMKTIASAGVLHLTINWPSGKGEGDSCSCKLDIIH